MKLSKKGREKIGEFVYDFHRCVVSSYAKVITPLKFESDDFEDVVVLTVEEAKEILQSSYDLLSWANCPCIQEDKALEIQSYLKERIKQVEKDHASN